MYFCYNCHHEVELEVKPTRFDQCEFCQAYLRCCYNCKFYNPSYPNECMETNSAFVADRAAGNFCGYYHFATGKERLGDKIGKNDVKKSFDSLFKK